MSSVFEKALSLEWNGKVFILTIRNEITANTTVAGNTFLYSYDGKSWLPSSNITTSSLSNTNPYNVKWTGQKYLMETSTNINQSSDGLNWCPINTTFPVKPNLTLANFSTLSPTNLSDTNIALSGDGNMVVVSKYASGSTIYYSKYSGGVWSTLTSTGISTAGGGWKGISLSYTGSPMLISGSENSLYILSAGIWVKSAVFSPSDTQGSALSQDGTRAVFAFYSGGFGFFSYNGSVWSSQTSVTINTTTYPSATYNSFKGIGMNLQGTTVVIYATSNSSFFYSNYNGFTWSALTLILTSSVVPGMNLNNGIEIDIWNNIYIGGYGSRYVFKSTYSAKAVGNKWSEFSAIIDASYNPIGFSVSENGRMAIAASNGNAYVYDNIVSGIYDVEVNLEQTNTISFPQNTTLALGGILADTTKIAYSTDSGLTWTPAQSSASVFSTSCNNATWNGKIWVAVGSGGNTIATSPDGRTWTGRGSYIFTTQGNAVEWSKELCLWVAVGQGTNSIAYSTDGIYWFSALVASSQGLTSGTDIKWNSRTWVATGTSSLIGIFSSVDGQTWTQVPLSNIGLPPVTNYGGTWTQTTQITDSWITNAINYTGQYQTAVDASGAVFTSSNFGAAWSYSQFTLPSFVQPLVAFLAINSSGSQQYLLVGGGGLWISSNYGATWSYNNNFPTNSNWTSVATDSIGLNVLASSASSVGASAGLWLSANSGATWAQIGSYSNIPFNGCTVSATGQYMSAIDIYGGVYISSNYGQTWTISVAGSGFVVPTKIAGSSSGQYLTASDYGTNTYTVDAYYTMLSSATNGVMDTAGNIYMGGSQSVPSQVIYKISSSGSGMVVTPIGNVGVYVNQNFAIAIDNTNGFLYFIGVSGPTVYKTVIATGVTTGLTALNTSLNGVSTATPSGIVCDTLGNLYILTASTGGTTAYICAYTTSSVFSTIVTKTVTTGGLGLGIDKSNNIYLSYPTQVDQYSTGGTLTLSGFYNSGRLVKYMTFDMPGNGYFYDVSGVYKVTLGQSTTYLSTQTFISGITKPYFIVQDINGYFYITLNAGSIVLQYSSTGSLLNSSFITGLTNAAGLTFDAFNNLYVINPGANAVYQYKITNGSITSSNTTFITTGLNGPNACIFDKTGNFYVTSNNANAICKYTMSNTSTNTITNTNTSFITGISNPWSIAVDSVGNLYFTDAITNGTVRKYSTGGVLTTFISGLSSPLGVTIDSGNNFYVTQLSISYISKYSSSGSLINASYITNLTTPILVYFDSAQNLYITNNGANTVTKTSVQNNSLITTGLSSPQYSCVDSTGAVYTTNATAGTVTKYGPIGSVFTSSGMNGAEQIGFDNNGYAYVSNYGGTISQYNSSGALLNANFITGGSACIGMVLDSQNNIYLVNRPTGSTGYIAKYVTSNGSLSSSNTSFITSLSGPQALVIDTNNNLYISQANNYGVTAGFISKYTTAGTVVTASFISSLNNPNQMAFDSYGNIYVALTGGNYIAKYSYNGTVISSTFISFSIPMGLVIDSYNNIYVSQYSTTNSGFASKYSPTGALITSGYAGITGLNLNYLSLDLSNNLYAVNGSNIVHKATNTNQTIISGLSSPTGCCLDSANNLYVSNSTAGTIVQYGPSLASSTLPPQASSTFANTGLASPFMVCFDSNGYIYVANENATTKNSINTVIQYNPNGTVKNANFVSAISSTDINLWGMAIDAYNNMYIVSGNQGKVFKYSINSSGNISASNTSFITTGLTTPQSCCFDSAGNFYVSCYNGGNGYINKYGMANGSITTTTANYITGVGNTWQIAFDSANNLYVCNLNGNVYKYGPTGTLISNTFITIGGPIGIAIDPFGNIYISVFSDSGYVSKYNSSGTLINSAYIPSLNCPAQLSYNSGYLYVPVSTYTGQVGGSVLIVTTGMNNFATTGLAAPFMVCMDSNGFIYVANQNGNTTNGINIVVQYNPNGTVKNSNFISAISTTCINTWGMAIDSYNNMYITIGSQNIVCQYTINSSGNITSSNTSFITSGLTTPQSCCFDNAGNFYVTNNANGNTGFINKYVMSYGTITSTINNFITGPVNNNPWQIAFDSLNNIYVANYNASSVSKYSPSGTLVSSSFLSISITNIVGIAIDPFGYIYVSSYTSGYVSKFNSIGTLINQNYITSLSYPAQLSYISGYLYVAVSTGVTSNTGSILKVNAAMNPIYVSSLTSPLGCSFDNSNNFYVSNSNNITKNNKTTTITTITAATSYSPLNCTFDSNNNLYVSSGSNRNNIIMFTNNTYVKTITPTGTAFNSIYGVTYNNGYIYACNYGNSTVSKYNISTNANASFCSFTNAIYCSVDSTGNVYVSNYSGSGVIGMFSSSGTTLNASLITGNSPYGTCFDSFGYLYVNWTGGSQTIVKYQISGTNATAVTGFSISLTGGSRGLTIDSYNNLYSATLNVYSSKTGSLIKNISTTNNGEGLNVDNNGNLYVCAASFVQITFTSTTLATYITGLTTPNSIVADSTNNLYITNGPYLSKYNSSGTLVSQSFPSITSSTFATIATNSNGLCSDANNNFYVTNAPGNYVAKITSTGTVNNSFITGITNPTDCKIDPYGNFFVVCAAATGLVYKFPSTGGSTPTNTFTVGNTPYCGTFDSFGNFYVTNSGSGSISKINAGATSAAGVTISYSTGYTTPVGIVCDANNNLYIMDYNAKKLLYLAYGTTTPVLLYTFSVNPWYLCINQKFIYITNAPNILQYNIITNTVVSISSSFSNTTGLTFDNGKTNLYVVDVNSANMYKITNLYELTSPNGLSIDSGNNLYVTSGSTVQKFNSSGAVITGTYLQNLSSPIGLTIDSVNNLYVVQNGSNTVNRYNNNIHLSQTIINSSSNTLTAYLPSSYGFSTNPTNLFNIDSANNLYLSAPYPSNSFVIYKYSAFTLSTYYANAATPYLANDSSYNLYWTTNANTVVKFNPYTKSQTTFIDISGSQQGVSILQAPSALTFDIAQNLYLCCSGNIIKVAAGSKAVSTFSTIQATYAIIADSSSNIYAMAATTPSHTVYKITQAGVQTTFFDSTKGLYSGYGLAIDAPGNIYIGSVNQAQTQTVIYKISPQGIQTTVYTTSTVNAVLGYAPLSVDKYGNLYLYDNNQIIVINPNGNSSTISNVSTLPTSFAFDNTNTIYMTDTSYNTSLNTITLGNTVLNTSSNYGATWTAGSLQNITAIANAGQFQSVIANGQIYISSNYGSSFVTATGVGFSNMKSVALSQNSYAGLFQTGIQSTGNIYTSNQVSYNNITKVLWNGIYWTGVISGSQNPIMTSTNGISWTNLPGNPFSGNIIQNGFYSSRTGQTLFIGSYTGSVTVPTFTSTPSNAFGNTITQNSITRLYSTSNNINAFNTINLPSISNTLSVTQNTTQPLNSVFVLGAWNISTWGMTTFPDTTALWIYNIPGAASTAPVNQSSPIIFQYTYNNTTNSSISANIYIVVDDLCGLYINGVQYGSTLISGGWPNAATNVPITIVPGKNIFQIVSINAGAAANPAGLLVTVIANSIVLFNSNAAWTYQQPSIGSPNAMSYNGIYYLLGGNAVATSPDLRTWTYGLAISGMSQINNFAWNNPDQGSASIAPLSIAVGAGSNTIAYSIDGIYWQGTGASVFTSQGNKAVWNGQLWCAVGMGGYWVATSYDGIVWTGRDNYWMQQGYDIAWNGQIFIAVGYGLVTMAASADGVNWQGIVRTPLDIYASSITWTGKIWLAYGAGATTSTAYSSQVLGSGWQSTSQPSIAIQNAQTVFSPAYFTTASLEGGYSATASSQQVGYESYRAFDDKFSATTGQLTSWFSAAGTYAAATGQYLGSQTTSYTGGSVTGEWLQIQLPKTTPIIYYYIVFTIDTSNTSIPTGWTLLGSQTGTSWTLIENFSFGPQTTPPNNTNGYPFLVIPRNIVNTGAAYQYYRIVIPTIFGGGSQNYVKIAEFDLYTAISTSNQLTPITRPIVTKTHVLHPTNLLYMQGVGYQTFYIATDLNGNQISNYYLNQAGYANSAVYGLGASPTVAQAFDGQNYLVLANSGAATYLSNQAANTTLNFSPTYNGTTINTNLMKAYAAAYNKRSILLGGANGQIGSITYATLGTGSSPIFRQTNAASLFTAVYGLASNSGYGPVYVPNAIYMKPQEKISIIGPKAYSSAVSNTAITMNLTNAQILTNITNSLNSIAIYGETGPRGDQGAVGAQGIIGVGPVGWIGQNGDIGQIGSTGAQGEIGQTADTGSQGQIGDIGLLGTQGQIGEPGITGPPGPLDSQWSFITADSSNIKTDYSFIGINTPVPSHIIDISGITNCKNMIGGNIQVLENLALQGVAIRQTQADISGSIAISNSMIIGSGSGAPQAPLYGLVIQGSQMVSNISYMNQIAENVNSGAPDSIGNLVLDISQSGLWVLDMSNSAKNITCQIENIPLTSLPRGIFYLTVYLDYSQVAQPGGYYITSIIVGSQTYSILFNGGGTPIITNLGNYIKQSISILVLNGQIVQIISTI